MFKIMINFNVLFKSFCLFLVSQKIVYLCDKGFTKILSSILIKICNVFTGCCRNFVDNSLQLDCDNKKDAGLLQTNFEDMAMVGLDAMQRANSTLEDFVSSCFLLRIGLRLSRITLSSFIYFPAFLKHFSNTTRVQSLPMN
jgi:hypothetical protein